MTNFAFMSSQKLLLHEYEGTAIIAGTRNISYAEVLQRISFFATKIPIQAQQKVVIYCENGEGWIYSLFASWQKKGVVVPVDVTSTVPDLVYIIKDCQPSCIWTSRKKKDTIRQAMSELGVEIPLLCVEDYEKVSLETTEKAYVPYQSDQLALIIYTSGTTGAPKGVMLSFGNIMANVNSVSKEVPIFRPELRTLVLLPLHHVLPLMGSVVAPFVVGGGVTISPSMLPNDIMETLKNGKVGIIIGVPRLWQTIYKGVMSKINASCITRFLFFVAKKIGSRSLSRFLFKAVKTKMGGYLTYCVSGGAALDKEISMGMRTLGLDVLEGYGMSETAPIIAFTRPDDIKPGCVGQPMPSVKVKIEEDEICVKGPNVMPGYYNRPEETAKVMDKDGWLHTGDLGCFDKKGRLIITGRKKEIIVLSNGKNVNPAELEYKIEKFSAYVKEAAVLQDADKLRAIIVPQSAYYNMEDAELTAILKKSVLEPYNSSVSPYKRIMSLFIYRGELPRTRLDKLQRFKLPSLLLNDFSKEKKSHKVVEPSFPEYRLIRDYISQEKKCEVHPTDHLETDLALDSLDKVSLQGFLEMTFGMDIEQERLVSFKNVTELAEYVADFKSFIEEDKMDWNRLVNQPVDRFPLPKTWKTGWFLVRTFELLAKGYFRTSYKGRENLPESSPYILACNHQSFLDGMFVMAGLERKTMESTYFYAKAEHVKNPLVKMIAHRHNVIVMSSTNVKYSILQLVKVLRSNKNIMIFPEGTRTSDGELGEFKKTFAILSKELNVPVVPVSISGAFKAFPRGSKIPRPYHVQVDFMTPVYPETDMSYEDLAEKVKGLIGRNAAEV